MSTVKGQQVGDIIKIPESHAVAVREMFESSTSAQEAADHYTNLMSTRKKQAWELVKSILPETDGFGMKYHRDRNEVVLISNNGTEFILRKRMEENVGLCVAESLCLIKEHLVAKQEFDLASDVRNLEKIALGMEL